MPEPFFGRDRALGLAYLVGDRFVIDHYPDIQLVCQNSFHSRLHPKVPLADVRFPVCNAAAHIELRRPDAPGVELFCYRRHPVALNVEAEYLPDDVCGFFIDAYLIGIPVLVIAHWQSLYQPLVLLLLTHSRRDLSADILAVEVVDYLLEADDKIVILVGTVNAFSRRSVGKLPPSALT